jgi:hypothetical protein
MRLAIVLAVIASGIACEPICKRGHYVTMTVPQSCAMETFGNPGFPYPLGDGIGGVKIPIEVCTPPHEINTFLCDEYEAAR